MEKIWIFLLLFLYWSHLEPNFKKSPLRIRDISIYQWLTSYFRVVHYLWQYYTDDRCVLILHEYWQKTNRWHGVEVRKDPSSSSILELSLFSDPQRGHIWFTFCGLRVEFSLISLTLHAMIFSLLFCYCVPLLLCVCLQGLHYNHRIGAGHNSLGNLIIFLKR